MFYSLFIIAATSTDTATLLDILVVCSFATPVWVCYYVGVFSRVNKRIKTLRLNARLSSLWRPYFKKDGYYGSASDKTIWD